MDPAALHRRLDRLWRGDGFRVQRGADGSECAAGLSWAAPAYDWDQDRHPPHPAGPRVILQLSLVGSGRFSADGGPEQRLDPGTWFQVIVPGDRFRYRLAATHDRWRSCWCWFRHDWLVERVRRSQALCGPCPALPAGAELLEGMLQIHQLLSPAPAPDPWRLEAVLMQVSCILGREAERQAAGGERQRLLAAVDELVAAAPERAPTVADLARRIGCSPSSLAHRFRSHTGQRPSRALLAARLERVRQLLTDSDLSLAEIAPRCGFAAANHLCRVFRSQVGLTPARYRAMWRQDGR